LITDMNRRIPAGSDRDIDGLNGASP
jgi:hypothetical protein